MGNKMGWPLVIILFGVVGLSFLTHAGAPAAAPPLQGMPEMLMEAGFKVYPAETSQEIIFLKSCPKGTLMIQQQIGRVIYCFVDPASNKMYMGNYSAYRNLQDLWEKQRQEIKKRVESGQEQGQEIKEKRIESDQEFWNTWGRRYGAF